jgi:hypothetical protein
MPTETRRLINESKDHAAAAAKSLTVYRLQCDEYIASNERLCSQSQQAIAQSRALLAKRPAKE